MKKQKKVVAYDTSFSPTATVNLSPVALTNPDDYPDRVLTFNHQYHYSDTVFGYCDKGLLLFSFPFNFHYLCLTIIRVPGCSVPWDFGIPPTQLVYAKDSNSILQGRDRNYLSKDTQHAQQVSTVHFNPALTQETQETQEAHKMANIGNAK
uniref:Uncharacterized protein n=1 Tax=Romanomermis culicivorax TaxID=13658 RepID=A0A915HI57_ROMCU